MLVYQRVISGFNTIDMEKTTINYRTKYDLALKKPIFLMWEIQ
jgi:hypothetical protein